MTDVRIELDKYYHPAPMVISDGPSEIHEWIVQNCIGKVYCYKNAYYFELKEDITQFKLRWL